MPAPFPPKKKSAPASDLSAPRGYDDMPKGPMAPAKPAPKVPKPAPAPEDVRHEQGEQTMDFAAIGEKFGLTPDESKAFAYDVLEACMKATGGAAHEENEPEAAEEGPGEGEEFTE